MLAGSSLLFTAGLAALAAAQGPASLVAAWLLIGLAVGAGLYESAFAALVRLYGNQARPAITGITLIAGFASTIGWPLTAWLQAKTGWRGACAAWAGLHLCLALPLYVALPAAAHAAAPATKQPAAGAAGTPGAAPARTAWLLAFVFGAT